MAKFRLWRKVVTETISNWDAHDAWTQSAALAFYTLFSLAPVLVVVSSVSGAFFGRERVRSQVVREFEQLIGTDAGQAIQGILDKAAGSVTGGLAGILGILTLIFGATAVFIQLQSALNVVCARMLYTTSFARRFKSASSGARARLTGSGARSRSKRRRRSAA
jgi:membrane protein